MQEKCDKEFGDLIPAYALGCLDQGEVRKLEGHLSGCEICSAELATYEQVVDDLALATPMVAPSPALKKRLQSQIKPPPPQPETVSWLPRWLTPNAEGKYPIWVPILTGFFLLFLLAGVLVGFSTPDNLVELVGTDAATEARGRLLFSQGESKGDLVVVGLPVVSAEQQYQLWLIKGDVRESGAVFSVDDKGGQVVSVSSDKWTLDQCDAFGITLEPAGGSPDPTGIKYLGGVPTSSN